MGGHARVWVGAFAVMMLCSGAVPVVAAVAAHAPVPTLVYHTTNVQSTNWGGFAVTGSTHSVTKVEGSWVQPAIHGTCPAGKYQYASFWVGIDGYTSSTVEQTGTDSDCQNGVATYYAWYEFYPNPSYLISTVPIHAGDVIFAEVAYQTPTTANGHKDFTLTLKDLTSTKSFTKAGKVSNPQRNSAEWIGEAPSSSSGVLPLADFGTVKFGYDSTNVTSTNDATVSGTLGNIGSFSHIDAITMINNAGTQTKASVSALSSDGTSFQMTWVSAGP